MGKTVRFTKKFGRYNVDQQKQVTNSDADRLQKLGLAEILPDQSEAGGMTRAITTNTPPRPRGRPKKAKAAEKVEDAAPETARVELDSSGEPDDSGAGE